jgi:hypothetical protein
VIRPRLRYLIPFLILASIVSVLSGTVLTSYSYTQGGVAIMNYGFPLPWQTVSGTSCGYYSLQPLEAYPVLNGPCLKSCCDTTYNLAFFLFDVLFYAAIPYVLLLGYHNLMRGIDRRASEWISNQPSEKNNESGQPSEKESKSTQLGA